MKKIFHLKGKGKISVIVIYKEQKLDYILDTSLPVQTNIKNICSELDKSDLKIQDLSLRNFETEELITDENIKTIIKDGDHVSLVASSIIEAAETVKNMESSDEAVVKRTIFMLQKYIKEVEFADEFNRLGGVEKLQKLIMNCEGNTLAYALKSFENLMEHDHGWENITEEFVCNVGVKITKEQFVNICRPATNIIIKLVCADKSSKGVQCYGYNIVNKAVTSNEFLQTLIQRLTETEYVLQVNSLHLINALYKHVTDEHREEYVNELNELKINKTVMDLMIRNPEIELTKQLIEFQHLTIHDANIKKNTQISMDNEDHTKLLNEIWELSELTESGDTKWVKLGFSSENPNNDLYKVGLFGLEIINNYAKFDTETYKNIVQKESENTDGKSCPVMRAAIEIIDIFCSCWNITKEDENATNFQPLIFDIENVFGITLQCFVKLWHESDIKQNPEDLIHVASLVKSQFKFSLEKTEKSGVDIINQFKTEMLETPYQTIKDRQ